MPANSRWDLIQGLKVSESCPLKKFSLFVCNLLFDSKQNYNVHIFYINYLFIYTYHVCGHTRLSNEILVILQLGYH